MNDDQLDGMFQRGPQVPAGLDERIRARILQDTQPVKPLIGGLLLGLVFVAVFVAASMLFAAVFKFKGMHVLSLEAAVELLMVLVIAALFGFQTVARSMRPASGKLRSWLIGGLVFVAYEVLIFRFFSNQFEIGRFVHQGLVCFALGVLCACFAAAPIWMVVRRGLVVEPVKAGTAIGLVSGLTGLTFLTMHCPVLEVPHTAVWHAAVMVFCTAIGALAGRSSINKFNQN